MKKNLYFLITFIKFCLLFRDSLLMRVRAQVMTREDGGWVPLGNGGFSLIGIYKKSRDDKKVEYMIVGTTTENSMVSVG